MYNVNIWELFIIFLIVIPLFFLPIIIAILKNHPYKIPVALLNIFGALFLGVGWLIALIWCFVIPEKKAFLVSGFAAEIGKLHTLKEKGVISEEEFDVKKKELIQCIVIEKW